MTSAVSKTTQQCTLDLRVYDDDTTHTANRGNSRSSTRVTKNRQKPGKIIFPTGSRVTLSPKYQQPENHCVPAKRPYARRYNSNWNSDSSLKGWIESVPDDVHTARCKKCNILLPAHYQQLKSHALCPVHVSNSASLQTITDAKLVARSEEIDHRVAATSKQVAVSSDNCNNNNDCVKRCHLSQKTIRPLPRDNSEAAVANSGKSRMKTKSSCYLLSRSQWERYRQKYRAEWETDPLFQGWIAPVSGDVYKARCLYCHIIVRAHYKDLKVHARTAKHAHNVAVNQPGFIADPSSPAAKPLLNRRRAFGPQRTTRFDSLHGTGPLSAAGLTAHEQGDDAVLLVPDESLASQSSLVSMAVYPSGQPIAQNVTTLVMPNRLPLDETVAASLLVSPDCDNTTYSVKKLHPLSVDKTRQKSGSETDACVNSMPSLYDVARGITLWEFLRLKVRKDSDRPHSAPRLAQMIGEFDALMQQLRSVVQDQLVPVSPKTGIAHHASKILVDEDLARSLGLKTGRYAIKQSPQTAASSRQRPKKRDRKSASVQENIPPDAVGSGDWSMGESFVQANSFDELIEFATSSATPRDVGDFEPTQMESDYMDGPVVKIEELPGSVSGISGASEEEVLFCYMAQGSQSADDLPSMEQGLSFSQSTTVTSVPVTQCSTLSFPLTLTVDSSPLDKFTSLRFS